MRNDRLREVSADLKALKNPVIPGDGEYGFCMSHYNKRRIFHHIPDTTEKECATAGCIAGWIVMKFGSGYQKQAMYEGKVYFEVSVWAKDLLEPADQEEKIKIGYLFEPHDRLSVASWDAITPMQAALAIDWLIATGESHWDRAILNEAP